MIIHESHRIVCFHFHWNFVIPHWLQLRWGSGNSYAMNHSPQQYHHYKALDPDLDEYLSEYKNQTPLESDHYAGKCFSIISSHSQKMSSTHFDHNSHNTEVGNDLIGPMETRTARHCLWSSNRSSSCTTTITIVSLIICTMKFQSRDQTCSFLLLCLPILGTEHFHYAIILQFYLNSLSACTCFENCFSFSFIFFEKKNKKPVPSSAVACVKCKICKAAKTSTIFFCHSSRSLSRTFSHSSSPLWLWSLQCTYIWDSHSHAPSLHNCCVLWLKWKCK